MDTAYFVCLLGFLQMFVLLCRGATINCPRGDPAHLHTTWAQYVESESLDAHESLFATGSYRPTIAGQLAADTRSMELLYIDGDRDEAKCVGEAADLAGGAGMETRSYCPWYSVLNFDNKRFPATLYENKCTCNYGIGMGVKAACVPITYNVRVLRKTGECTSDGFNEWVGGWQSLAVGCTPVFVEATAPA